MTLALRQIDSELNERFYNRKLQSVLRGEIENNDFQMQKIYISRSTGAVRIKVMAIAAGFSENKLN